MQETTGEADKYLKITTSCLAQTISPLLGKQSFVLELLYLFFITGWQRWYLNIIIKILNARTVLWCTKILKPDGPTTPCLHTKANGTLLLPPSCGSQPAGLPTATWGGWVGRVVWVQGRVWRERSVPVWQAVLFHIEVCFLSSGCLPGADNIAVLCFGNSVAPAYHLCCIFSHVLLGLSYTAKASGWFSAPCRCSAC